MDWSIYGNVDAKYDENMELSHLRDDHSAN